MAIPRTEGVLNTISVRSETIVVGGFAGPTFQASIHVFRDGSWTAASVPASPGQVTGITAFGERLIAVGNTLPDTRTGFIWSSTDGHQWSVAATIDDAALHDVAVGDGVVVAVGARLDPENNATARAWTSTDGATWRRARVARGAGAAMGSVTPTPTGFAAIGDRRLGQPRPVWTTTAPTAWTSVTNDLDDQRLPIDRSTRSVGTRHGDSSRWAPGMASTRRGCSTHPPERRRERRL